MTASVPETEDVHETPANVGVRASRAPHGEGCECTRCKGFEPGHDHSLRHGAYSVLRLSARAGEIADLLQGELPGVPRAVLEVGATTLARVEAADRALGQLDEAIGSGSGSDLAGFVGERATSLERLRQDLRGWTHSALRYFTELGMTPASAARIEAALAGGPTVNVLNVIAASPEWQAIRARLVAALTPFPDALDAVVLALEAGDDGVATVTASDGSTGRDRVARHLGPVGSRVLHGRERER